MRIRFLGTSAGWPLPRLGCKCEICSSTDPKDKRTRTQILIDDSVLLDAGPETYNHLISLDSIASKLKAILVSHEHPDHILGLWDLPHIYGRAENNIDKINLYITHPVLNGIRRVFATPFQPIKPTIVKPNQTFNINHAQAQYFPVIHGKTPAFGVKYKDGKILAYIPDFNRILPSQQRIIRDCHLLIIDGSSLGKLGQSPTHISIEDGVKIAQNLKAKNVYFVHIGHKTGTHQFLEEYLRKNLPRRQAGAGPNFHIAYDGLELLV
ncbi:hypothetical protein A2697_03515 [Candidatus Curtissbacteria bacterium RIFCSPHIGHO2_01_FULL_41_44]|uniref:Metallo-beta-lactamase domain-containing protein n=1 Tax=Candidatus Curtissbacteria bacterium RIFCSPLOWO2_01_FULL_42_50 TaxID=1797730 RepID=A0A1F5H7Q6_9BACT|nr:MAG: hypothetical protein A2697_03515 [Candidatus Curtissbacteria bacterium RIFCSPHIGHO2_01_FULL_41_44]OGD94235.1 MAG: hypothetical protein A3C33_02670 [Candidatus Curtissbacteria bacterium RIFCSPHIGHO2_02_FULL_42_58]OGD97709.1 MAG: hypothetical protein A3E71_03180 [Candidatus Curtissbacteria bacterium RIFCSPHIGHO2_12_FULL_42_33]OGE00102.1 MAG: hypothetical protein A3B54_01730 [Candidatus Curtissbacteria bacterium RIFCSPLOWO2_01_FULL_42_50]OGE02027.1 MAG: hypothetical protein A3G16_00035 [Ca